MYLTIEEAIRQGVIVMPAHPGVTVRSGAGVEVVWESWRHWRFGQRCPELVHFEDVPPAMVREVVA